MLRERGGERFDGWLSRVGEQGVSELQSFANGLKKDDDAVKAGLTLEWSQGQVEGQVHRLKLIKRQMYGRGSFKFLRKRVLQRAYKKSVIAMVESGLEALAENQTTNELLAERGGGTPRRGPHAFSSGLTALAFPRTGRFSIREVVLEGYATRQKTGISSQSAQAIFLCLRQRLSLSTHPRFIKSSGDPFLQCY